MIPAGHALVLHWIKTYSSQVFLLPEIITMLPTVDTVIIFWGKN
jgi:hypothetical protein